MKDFIKSKIKASADLKTSLLSNDAILNTINSVVTDIITCYKKDGKVLWAGNGGSAADAQHLAAELSGRFYYDRPPLFSEALHVNTSYTTAVANDYSYDEIYARLTKAMEVANQLGIITVGFTGETGGKMAGLCKYLVNIPSKDTPRIQECHMVIGHTICELVEMNLFPKK